MVGERDGCRAVWMEREAIWEWLRAEWLGSTATAGEGIVIPPACSTPDTEGPPVAYAGTSLLRKEVLLIRPAERSEMR